MRRKRKWSGVRIWIKPHTRHGKYVKGYWRYKRQRSRR